MTTRTKLLPAIAVAFSFVIASALLPGQVLGQVRHPPSLKEFLAQFKGKEILILDKTTGVEQFVTGDPSKAYSVVLNDVQDDYIIVTRNTENDKRTFVYPISIIRRVIFLFDGKLYDKIVIEMY